MRVDVLLVFVISAATVSSMSLPVNEQDGIVKKVDETLNESRDERPDNEENDKDPPDLQTLAGLLKSRSFLGAQNRPILTEGSYGFRHAMHMSSHRHRHDLVNLEERRKQSFKTTFLTDTKRCNEGRKDCRRHMEYRTIDGGCNNVKRSDWGQSEQPYRRLLPRKRSMVECGNAAVSFLPNARVVSRLLAKRSEADVSKTLSMFIMVWGQLIDHDMMMTELRSTPEGDFLDCCDRENFDSPDCCPIEVPRGDFFFGQKGRPDCIPFLRSKITLFPGNCKNKLLPDVQNSNTAWLDQSYIYGSTEEVGKDMRSERGDGKLKHSLDKDGRMFPHIEVDDEFRMLFGDSRSDIHPAITMLHTTFLRYHNRLADRLAGLHPAWSSDKIFNEARKINMAIGQHITYTQFMDVLLGTPNDVRTFRNLHHDYYRQSVDPRISMIFQTAAFRLHTTIHGRLELRDPRYRVNDTMLLRDVFHNPLRLLNGTTYDDICRGLAAQSVAEFNNLYTSEMTEWLFAEKDEDFGLDILSLNIQRGRDHQIQGYASYREHCGLGSVNSWDDFADFITHDNVHKLIHTYRRPQDVDMFIASNMEVPVEGSLLGPTVHCFVREQFENLRDGDRFFYTRPTEFSGSQLAAIKKMSLSNILCVTADDPSTMRLPANVFKKVHGRKNPLFSCSEFKDVDLSPWR